MSKLLQRKIQGKSRSTFNAGMEKSIQNRL